MGSISPLLGVVVAHYHPKGRVAADLKALVRHFASLTDRVVFVSTGIDPAQAQELEPFAHVIARENFGYDFWSYKLGIDALGELTGLDRVLLCNSSFVTLDPALLCQSILGEVEAPALRGLTLSADGVVHAQSYWVSFEHPDLILSPEFSQWWSDMVPISDRQEVIDRYERGMSAYFADMGFPVTACFVPDYSDILVGMCRAAASRRIKFVDVKREFSVDLDTFRILNPTHFLWDAVAERFGILKHDLIKHNPQGLDLSELQARMLSDPEFRERIADSIAD